MTDRIVIQVDDDKAQRWFSELMQRSSDMSGLMAEIGGVLTESAQDRFKTGTAPDGTRWAPLKDGSGRRPLLKTGTMRDQIAPTSGAAFVEIVASAKQARWHQEGTGPYVIRPKTKKALAWAGGPGPRKKVNHPGLPARPFIGVSRSDEQGIERLAAAWLDPPAS
ncbi:MAG: phage virion morphogenesis protein [Panacagrimonas sp.]